MTERRPSAIVTGAGGGIGFATARGLVERGYDVFAVDLDVGPLKQVAGEALHPVELDVTDDAGVAALVERVHEATGGIDLLVNNAAIAQPGAVECVPMEAARRQFDVNLFGYMRFAQAVLPRMRAQRSGRIIQVSSALGKLALPGFGWYAATKHAIEAMSDAMREEVRQFGIDVVVIEPGVVGSAFIERQNAMMAQVPHPPEYANVTASVVEGIQGVPKADPARIGEAIVRAATAKHPPLRVALPLGAKLAIQGRRFLGDRLLYWAIRKRAKL